MTFNQQTESFEYINRLNNNYSFQDVNQNFMNNANIINNSDLISQQQSQSRMNLGSASNGNLSSQFASSLNISPFDSQSNQQQQYLLQLQIQEAQAQVQAQQAQQAQFQNNSLSQQKRAYSVAYPLYNQPFGNSLSNNEMFLPSQFSNNLPNQINDFNLASHNTSIGSINNDLLNSNSKAGLSSQTIQEVPEDTFQSQLLPLQKQQQQQQQQQHLQQLQLQQQIQSRNPSIADNTNINNNGITNVSNVSANIANSNFNLPVELQGGVNNIFNRRPSYAADVQANQRNNLESNLMHNKINLKQYALQYNHLNNKRNTIYENPRGSIDQSTSFNPLNNTSQAKGQNMHSFSSISSHSSSNSSLPLSGNLDSMNINRSISDLDTIYVKLDDGLLLNKATNTIITSPELKREFEKCSIYFGSFDIAMNVVDQLNNLLNSSPVDNNNEFLNNTELIIVQHRINKLLDFLLEQNEDLKSSNHMGNKNYSLILNKNGRLDIISFPKNSNLQLMQKDLIIIEGDRGKDLVMVLKPIIDFRFALFFNYLKKKLHLKSLEFGTDINRNNNNNNNNNSSNNNTNDKNRNFNKNNNQSHQKSIINEDENFITLPNKQILRFAKPHELSQLILKYNDEIMAYRICLNYSASLNLNLIIKNVEFQFDKKKLIIYYYCLQRLDFRGLIKELFKIYKTRIWLCAILPLEKSFRPLLDYELEKRNIKLDNVDELISPYLITKLKSNSSSISTDSMIDPLTIPNSNTKSNSAIENLTPPSTASSNVNGNLTVSYRSNTNVVNDKFPISDQIYQFNEINDPIYFHCKIFSNLIKMFCFEISNKDLFSDRYWFLDDESTA
ncbi:hypothetical protein DAPK24_010920 [Pichia kluyveri]|uniref:PSP1 C-terminal domain-containing protein n=1 Tax=Pichia kluyveri TaxID=36015 RepID=A0AAV5R0G5_PICKL|nr:hypothetical protein DAPK24_010920 [Pichia kluyveri]